MTKGISRIETTGPALAENLGWESDLGRASCCAELIHAFGLGHEPYSLCFLSLTLSISYKWLFFSTPFSLEFECKDCEESKVNKI
ncbi:hypothetical protein GQ457_04G019660 [Hibiscus cannabinus]